MVRATAAEAVKLIGNVYLPGWDATTVGYLCTDADYYLDAYVLKYYKTTLSTTDTAVVNIANHLVVNLMKRGSDIQAGRTKMEIQEIFTDEIKMLIEAVVGSTSYDGSHVADAWSDDL